MTVKYKRQTESSIMISSFNTLFMLALLVTSTTATHYSGSLPCYNNGEVYASAWIARSDMVLGNQKIENANLSWVSGEISTMFMISFEVQKNWREKESGSKKKDLNKQIQQGKAFLSDNGGLPIHSADVLDFAGVHLSSLERYANHVPSNDDRKPRRIREIQALVKPAVTLISKDAIEQQIAIKDGRTLKSLSAAGAVDLPFLKEIGEKTLVIIPYFAQVNKKEKIPSFLLYMYTRTFKYNPVRSGFKSFVSQSQTFYLIGQMANGRVVP